MPDPLEVTVASADIREFASVLDDLSRTLQDAVNEVRATAGVDFGEYANSQAASNKYVGRVTDIVRSLDALSAQTMYFTDGTVELARTYSDLSELNTAQASAITEALGESREGGEQ